MLHLNKRNIRWGLVSLIMLMVGISAFGLAAMRSIPDGSGVIHACFKSSGDLRLVDSASDCKNTETAIAWSQTGPPGQQGPAGQARDVGSVFPGTPNFYPQGLVGWVAVEHPSIGTYCLTPDPSVTQSNAVLMLTVGSPGATSQGQAIWTGYCGFSPLKFQVQTVTFGGSLTDLVYFTAMVP